MRHGAAMLFLEASKAVANSCHFLPIAVGLS
jgi:hypothetical protein